MTLRDLFQKHGFYGVHHVGRKGIYLSLFNEPVIFVNFEDRQFTVSDADDNAIGTFKNIHETLEFCLDAMAEEVDRLYGWECDDIAWECEAEGLPSHGETWEIRCDNALIWWAQNWPEYWNRLG